MTQRQTILAELLDWSERQRELMKRQVTLMQAGRMRVSDIRDGEALDESSFWIIENERRIAELDALTAQLAQDEPFDDET